MAKILCVEDNSEFSLYLTSVLGDHSVTLAPDIQRALELVQGGSNSFDLILLDITLPDGNSLKVLPQLRQGGVRPTPIIVLSGDSDIITKVAAFGVGADDYVSKPPNSSELRARIEARLRSSHMDERSKAQFQIGNLVIDSNAMNVLVHMDDGHETLELTPSEFKILKLVATRPGQVYSRDQLINQVWGAGKHVTPRTVDAHVSNLRKKLSNSDVKIETVTGSGYRAVIRHSERDWDKKN